MQQNYCEKAIGNATAKPYQNHGKTNKEHEEGIQNATKNEELLLVYVNM